MDFVNDDMILEETGINIEKEKSLHAAIKRWYKRPEDRLEAKVSGYIIDVVRENELIEVQTGNFSKVKKKLSALSENYNVTIVYPVAVEKTIIVVNGDGEVLRRRKSPKKGSMYTLFDELVRIPELILKDRISIEILFIWMDEIRIDDGKGSFRRKGVSLYDKRLTKVIDKIEFKTKEDFKAIIPETIAKEFTNKILAEELGITTRETTKITYCLNKMGVIKKSGKRGREQVYEKL